MAQDTKYAPISYVYLDRGLIARDVEDQCPKDTYLNNLNCLSRAENSMSSRYGTIIQNRDPAGTGTNNYYFTEPVTSLARLNYQSSAWRYAGLEDGSLWRRTGNNQGAYTELTLPTTVTGVQVVLSGDPFESLVDSCYETSQPFLFIYDSAASIKDQGTGDPQLTGIDPSPYSLNVLPYAPLLTMIESFEDYGGGTGTWPGSQSGISEWIWADVQTVYVVSGSLVTDFSQFVGVNFAVTGPAKYNPTVNAGGVTVTTDSSSSIVRSPAISGFPSVPISLVDTVTLYIVIEGQTNGGFGSFVGFQYSADGGNTWYPADGDGFQYGNGEGFFPPQTLYPTPIQLVISTSNLNLVQIAAAVSTAGKFGSTTTSTVMSAYAVVSVEGVTGSIASGMVSVLSGNTPVAVPISQVSSYNLVSGLYTELLVNTTDPHGLSASDTMGIYASSNDIVDGYYQVSSVVSPNSFTIPFQSASQIGATGGYATYVTSGGLPNPTPFACVVNNYYGDPLPQISAWGVNEWVPPSTTTFPFGCWSGAITTASATATVGNTIALDLDKNGAVTDDDLIVLTLDVSSPQNVEQMQLQFFVGSEANNYYSAFIAPAYYQGAISGSETAYEATESQILADTLGLITGQTPGTTSAQLQPTNISTGSGSWQACYIPRGNFLPVGLAGTAGLDWSNITGWLLTITTNSNTTPVAGITFACNGLYLQWGYGPSSFAGVGYDYRQTYYDAATGTESSPCPEQSFNANYGYLASTTAPIFLRQAAQVVGQYSPDPQVTHVRNYRRGGTLSDNWSQVGQIPNVTGAGQYIFKDVIADAYLEQAQLLVLDNDPPVTSSLVSPIQTTLAASTTLPSMSSIYSAFKPQVVTVAQADAIFVPNQLVVIGNPSSEEVVAVVAGGVGVFSAILRLEHNQGEPVSVYSVPRQACNLCAFAYNQVWLAGDPNNPHYLYFSKKGLPENFGPQNYIPVSTPDDPINAVINWRGTLIVGTLKSWWIIVGQGAIPYAQPTGSVHGIVAQNGWVEVEGAIYYRAPDGIREFTGADGVYKSLPIEWIYRGNPQCIPPQANPAQATQDVMAFYNNQIFESYISLNSGHRYRMIYDSNYQRYRYDDVAATAMLWEKDTNVFLVGKQIGVGKYAVVQDQIGDYDDGGWVAGALVQTPIIMTIQSPYRDLGKPHNQKQWNAYETDVNTQGQVMTSTLLFEDGAISVPLENASTSVRQKVELFVNDGLGQEAYRASIVHTIPVTVAPTLYQEDIYAAELAERTATVDSYWIKFGTDESKFAKQAYFDYSSPVPIDVSLYADNNPTPYFTFTLPAAATRMVIRQRFGNNNPGTTAFTFRTWRLVAVSSGAVPPEHFQMWSPIKVEWKPIGRNSYRPYELMT